MRASLSGVGHELFGILVHLSDLVGITLPLD